MFHPLDVFVFLQELLGLKFAEIKEADVWHEDVKMVSQLFLSHCSCWALWWFHNDELAYLFLIYFSYCSHVV